MARVVDVQGDEKDPERLGLLVLCPVPESVPRARRWFRKFTAHEELDCSIDDCVLLVSELVTNAIRYGSAEGIWRVRVEWYRVGQSLRVHVHNPGLPAGIRLRSPAADEAHGRGLLIVDTVCDEWWSGPSPHGGTVVVFVMYKAFGSSR